jgi:SAM-dependent methyltransferase
MRVCNTEFNEERTRMYLYAMNRSPNARNSELAALELTEFSPNRVIELGAGEGFLTKYLSSCHPKSQIYAIDASQFMLSQIPEMDNVVQLEQDVVCLPSGNGSVDLIISLANFHHVGRKERLFTDASMILNEDGYFIIADVHDGTPVQDFFDDVVKEYCITSHNFTFISTEDIQNLSGSVGMQVEKSEIKDTPWEFHSEEEMMIFVKHLFGLDISYRVLKDKVDQHFPIQNNTLPWQLGYHYIKNEN